MTENTSLSWEQAVVQLRAMPDQQNLISEAYLLANLKQNVANFMASNEWVATLELVRQHCTQGNKVLDIGAGNGIATIAFAKSGFTVASLEPDKSATVGSNAIRYLAAQHNLDHQISIKEGFGEQLPFEDNAFDLVYCRQVLHHAYDLPGFLAEVGRVTKPGGFLLWVRDHVITSAQNKQAFLKRHPIHHLYGGENAFTLHEYRSAIEGAGFRILHFWKPSQSALNYSPKTPSLLFLLVAQRFPWLRNLPWMEKIIWHIYIKRLNKLPGAIYSGLATKPIRN